MKEMITVEKEVYEAVLRNSVRVSDLEAENQQLKELLSKCLDELAEFNNSYYPETQELFSQITNSIGEKK